MTAADREAVCRQQPVFRDQSPRIYCTDHQCFLSTSSACIILICMLTQSQSKQRPCSLPVNSSILLLLWLIRSYSCLSCILAFSHVDSLPVDGAPVSHTLPLPHTERFRLNSSACKCC